MARTARIAPLIESSRCIGREVLKGISSYMKTYDCWSVFHHERNLHDPAPRRLAVGNLPLARVAELAGFANVEWSSKLFHRKTGYTPGQYRRTVQFQTES